MTREDFFMKVPTQEATRFVGVSFSDNLHDAVSCLLQVTNTDGGFTCAYLSDDQARQLRDAIDAFLAIPHDVDQQVKPVQPCTCDANADSVKSCERHGDKDAYLAIPRDVAAHQGQVLSHQTTTYRQQYDAELEREHGPDNDLETYYSPIKDEICLSTGEREDFESGDGFDLEADILTQDQFEQLLAYVLADCGAKTFIKGEKEAANVNA